MLTIHTILCPVDFSEGSKAAFQLAEAVAFDYGARVIVVHVVEPPLAMGADSALMYQYEVNWEALRNQLAECYRANSRVLVEPVVVEGRIADEIVRLAREYEADVIVTSTHGRSGVPRLIMGSVAEQVLRHAPCPVLTVKQTVRSLPASSTPAAERLVEHTAAANEGSRP